MFVWLLGSGHIEDIDVLLPSGFLNLYRAKLIKFAFDAIKRSTNKLINVVFLVTVLSIFERCYSFAEHVDVSSIETQMQKLMSRIEAIERERVTDYSFFHPSFCRKFGHFLQSLEIDVLMIFE